MGSIPIGESGFFSLPHDCYMRDIMSLLTSELLETFWRRRTAFQGGGVEAVQCPSLAVSWSCMWYTTYTVRKQSFSSKILNDVIKTSRCIRDAQFMA